MHRPAHGVDRLFQGTAEAWGHDLFRHPDDRPFPGRNLARIILPMSPTVFREGGFRFYFF